MDIMAFLSWIPLAYKVPMVLVVVSSSYRDKEDRQRGVKDRTQKKLYRRARFCGGRERESRSVIYTS